MLVSFGTYLAAVVLWCVGADTVFAADTLVLDAKTNVVIRRAGPAEDDLHLATDVLERYLKIAMRRADLASAGPYVDILSRKKRGWRKCHLSSSR